MRHTATAQLITDHVDMARRVARSIARRVPFDRRDDLESAAFLGLTEAAQRFDPDRGEPFGAFAVQRVRGAVLDELRRGDVLSRQARTMARRVRRAIALHETQYGRAPTSAELANDLDLSIEDVEQMRGDLGQTVSIEAASVNALSHEDDPAEKLDRVRHTAMISEAMNKLSERERDVVSMYYEHGMKMKDIGAELGVTESRVSQMCSAALRSLKHAVRGASAPIAPRCRPRATRRSSFSAERRVA
jgi:RNA polymerase sigma factor for flagellar operon FliA